MEEYSVLRVNHNYFLPSADGHLDRFQARAVLNKAGHWCTSLLWNYVCISPGEMSRTGLAGLPLAESLQPAQQSFQELWAHPLMTTIPFRSQIPRLNFSLKGWHLQLLHFFIVVKYT